MAYDAARRVITQQPVPLQNIPLGPGLALSLLIQELLLLFVISATVLSALNVINTEHHTRFVQSTHTINIAHLHPRKVLAQDGARAARFPIKSVHSATQPRLVVMLVTPSITR